jgi:hypothetical protein
MDFMINIDLKPLPARINYNDKLLLVGSCFTEHIGNAMIDLKYDVMQNPNGILFDPSSVCRSLQSYIKPRKYLETDLFENAGVFHSWQHHSRFSGIDKTATVKLMNETQEKAQTFLKQANWIIITLGSAFFYQLSEEATMANEQAGAAVANCHRAPAQWFRKNLLTIDNIISEFDSCLHQLFHFNPALKIIFTISPVRHTRDGVQENNRSKARLIESVHQLVNKFDRLYYFPAYELVIDVLRDYRFYDIDLVHPNYMATEFVLEKFNSVCVDEASVKLSQEIKKLVIARRHKAFQPETQAHRDFLAVHLERTRQLQEKYPFLDLHEEINYFSAGGTGAQIL